MRIIDLEIYNFRGIKASTISFPIDSKIICLIGAGDSTKSTLLKAVEWLFWPTWNLSVADADFYHCDPSNTIIIRGTFTEFSDKLLADDKFGMYLRRPGVEFKDGVNDEPCDGKPLCLAMQLTIDSSLEAKWEIVCNREEPRNISHNDRRQLYVGTIGNDTAKDLEWGKYSVLQKYADAKGVLHHAYTTVVRNAAKDADLSELDNVSETLSNVGKHYGIGFNSKIKNRLLIQGSSFSSTVVLFDGDAPLTQFGTGSQRLLSMGLNIDAAPGKALLLVDEVENGLEPFRLRSLINEFRSDHNAVGQVIMTTHSPVAVAECTIDEIMVVHSSNGITEALFLKGEDQTINRAFQAQIRRLPESFLSKRIIVCEGRTEMGFIRAYDKYLAKTYEYRMAHKGIGMADGNGDSIFTTANIFNNCGYDVCILMDSDKDNKDGTAEKKRQAKSQGIPVFDWDQPNSIEEQFYQELPLSAIQEAIQIAISEKGLSTISSALTCCSVSFTETNSRITISMLTDEQRKVIGKIAKDNDWYKQIRPGEQLSDIVFNSLSKLDKTSIIKNVVNSLTEWVIGNDKARTR